MIENDCKIAEIGHQNWNSKYDRIKVHFDNGHHMFIMMPVEAVFDTPVEEEEPKVTEDYVIEKWARVLQDIYDFKTAGSYTFHGALSSFLLDPEWEEIEEKETT